MGTDDLGLIGSDETAFRLELTAAEMKVTHTALKCMLDDFGREQRDVQAVIRSVLAKLPSEVELRFVDVGTARRRAV